MQIKRYSIAILFLVCLMCCRYTAHAQCTSRYQDTIFSKIDSTMNVVFTTTAGGSAGSNLLLDVYQPDGDTACLRHLIIWEHGGAFVSGTKNDPSETFWSQRFAQRGYVCASINYRLAPSIIDLYDSSQIFTYAFKACADMKAAIRYFYMTAAAQNNPWRIDTNVIFIAGSSAGAIGADFVGLLDSLNELPPAFQTIVTNNGGIEGNSGNAGYSSKVVGVASLAGCIYSLDWIKPGVPTTVFCQGTADSILPYDCGYVLEDTIEDILHTFWPTLRMCGSGEMAPQFDSAQISTSLLPFPGSNHVPWDTTLVIENEVDSAVAAFFYSVNCVQATGYCNYPAGLTDIDLGPQVNVFPNPAHNVIHISITDANELKEIRLYDCTGRQVMQQYTGGKQATLATDGLAQGVYTLRLDLKGPATQPVARKVVIE